MENEKKPLVILAGPTAVGKTALSIGLAKEIGGEIISADSMQVYRGMDIGTAKITKEQMQGIPHYLIDELDPAEEFNVSVFQQKCKAYMERIYSRGKLPVIVGGTGFYIQSVLYDIDFSENDGDMAYRRRLEARAKAGEKQVLYDQLVQTDPAAAEKIHPNNVKRVIRALEYFHQTGQRISEHNEAQRQKPSPYQFVYYVLTLPREVLYERIDRRVDEMRARGLTEEVKRLMADGCRPDMVSMQGLGYQQIIRALQPGAADVTLADECQTNGMLVGGSQADGERIDETELLDRAYEQIKLETRHFAKRQFTWFQREKDVTWLHKEEFADEAALLSYCVQDIRNRILG